MHDTLILERLGGVTPRDIAQPRSLAADDCKATQHQASVLVSIVVDAGNTHECPTLSCHSTDNLPLCGCLRGTVLASRLLRLVDTQVDFQ